MTPKPIIVLVSGAFHLGSSMKLLSAELERMGWESRTMGLVTVNRADLTVKDDIATLNNEVLDPLIVKEGRDIILCLHSYAGFVASAAIAGMSKSERSATGRQGGIVGLIYMCAFCPTEGDTILGMVGGNPPPWMEVDVSPSITLLRISNRKLTPISMMRDS